MSRKQKGTNESKCDNVNLLHETKRTTTIFELNYENITWHKRKYGLQFSLAT